MASALIIIPTGTYRAEEYLAAATRLGVDVVVASEKTQAMREVMGDRFLEIDLADPRRAAAQIVEHDSRFRLDGVIAVDDQGLLAAALASEALGLPHSPPLAVSHTRDKASMRRAFQAAGVPQPDFAVVSPGSPEAVGEAAGALGLPVVVKPCSLSASRGVIRADSARQAAAVQPRIAHILVEAGEPADSTLLVEAFVEGPEVAVEAILSGGVLEVLTIFDKPDPLDGPYFEETLYLAPTRLDGERRLAVEQVTKEAVAALGLTDGPVHAELRLGATRPSVLEVAARTIGGRCSKALELEGGASLEELVISRALHIEGPPARLAGPAGTLMIPIPRNGKLARVANIDQVRALAHITGVEITIPIGSHVEALPEGDRYLGFVFARAAERDDVEGALRQAAELLEVTVTE